MFSRQRLKLLLERRFVRHYLSITLAGLGLLYFIWHFEAPFHRDLHPLSGLCLRGRLIMLFILPLIPNTVGEDGSLAAEPYVPVLGVSGFGDCVLLFCVL